MYLKLENQTGDLERLVDHAPQSGVFGSLVDGQEERHDLRRMTREQVTPLMWAQEGKTAADLIRMFGPPSHRGVKGIFDGTVVFRWDADGGTVAVEFTDAAPPVGPETLEEHMRRQAVPDDVRLRQLHFATWSWEHD